MLIEYLHANPAIFALIAGVFGLLAGSFLNVVILRLPVMMERQWHAQCMDFLKHAQKDAPAQSASHDASRTEQRFDLISPPSHCPSCGHMITPWENIPLFSYLFLKGRCSECGCRIPLRYPIVECVTAALSIVTAWHFGLGWAAGGALLLTWTLVCLTVIDIDHQLLPDSITLPFLWIGLILSLFGIFTDPRSAIIGALAGYLSLWTVYKLFKWLTAKEGMGYGDFKLLALLGAWMGWQILLPVILLSSLVGAIVGISLVLIQGRDKNLPIPFGPYLATAGWIILLWGNDLIQIYQDLLMST